MPDSRARIWFSVFVLAVFCLGGGVGLFIGWHVPPPHLIRQFPGHPGLPPWRGGHGLMHDIPHMPAVPPPEIVRRMEDELQLDSSQREQVEKLLDARRDRLEQIHRDALERFNHEARSLHEAIRAILRPDQQRKFDRFLEQHGPR